MRAQSRQTRVLGVDAEEYTGELPEARSRLCVCQAFFLMTFAMGGIPHAGSRHTCNAEDPSSIPGSGRSYGEGIGYSFQYSWASLVAQLVKESTCNAGDMGSVTEPMIPWRRERLPTPVFWPGEFHGLYSPWGHKESDTTE